MDNDYIDIDIEHIREHMMETMGALNTLDHFRDLIIRIIAGAADRYDLRDAIPDTDELMRGGNDPDTLTDVQRAVLDIIRGALAPAAAAMSRDMDAWRADLRERVEEEYPIVKDLDPFIPSKVLTPSGRHIIRIYADGETAERTSQRILDAYKLEEGRA